MIKPIIYNSDIKAIKKKNQSLSLTKAEVELLMLGENCTETKIQSRIVSIFRALQQELSCMWDMTSQNDLIIAQRDNGASSMSQRIKKAREGNLSGMCDLDIFLYNAKTKQNKVMFLECKRIGTPSQIEGDKLHYERQIKCQDRLRNMGFEVYLTNNPVYFEKVICEQIRQFYK